jgi:FdhD protein
MVRVKIVKVDVSAGKIWRTTDYVAEEKPLYIFLNRSHYATIFCSPSNLKELAVGHVLSEDIVKSAKEIESVSLKERSICRIRIKPNVNLERRLELSKPFSRVILSACGSSAPYQFSGKLPKITSNLKIGAEKILEGVRRLNFIAETFRKTGGVHVAAIYSSAGNLIAAAEDVGRHNAVDKVIGIGALNKINFGGCFLSVSGRLTGDMVLKAARLGVPVVASLAAAIDSGITVAKKTNLTLIGFVRGERMNVYNFPERIIDLGGV